MRTVPERWVEPVVRHLIDENDGRPPGPSLERHAERLVSEQDQLPIDPAAVASRLGISRSLRPLRFAGRIWVDERARTHLDIDSRQAPEQRRFSEAHALIHTAFPGFEAERRYRLDASPERKPRNREEEYLCDLGAGALLMPAALVRGRFDPRNGFAEVERLADVAEVTVEAAANRLVALSDEPVVLLCMSHANAPADRAQMRRGDIVFPRLRVRYAASKMVPVSIPRYETPDDGSKLAEAALYRGGRVIDRLPGGRHALFDIDAQEYDDRMLAFAWPAV